MEQEQYEYNTLTDLQSHPWVILCSRLKFDKTNPYTFEFVYNDLRYLYYVVRYNKYKKDYEKHIKRLQQEFV